MTVLGNNEHIIKKNVDYYGCLKGSFVVFFTASKWEGKVPLWYLDDEDAGDNETSSGIPQQLQTHRVEQ